MLHIQSTEKYVTSINFIDSNPFISSEASPEVLQHCITQIDEYFRGKRKVFDLELEQTGTNFQNKVWAQLTKIPYGKTISYLHLAQQTGDVKAIRAVAAANGRNKIAIAVPCHRVIGTNKTLTGYAGGLWRKKWLLEHEAKFSSGTQQLELIS
ncbi:MAG: methylated-DNA--[protein]-cysteine S-methyltransferase [Chitinophagaceae bacterium]|nr:methylated-DNA--[protein]-cysteine S-methyltransferase [Chitinophagaceae bacterium]